MQPKLYRHKKKMKKEEKKINKKKLMVNINLFNKLEKNN